MTETPHELCPSANMTRDFCARCGIKHLAQARVLMLERMKGYPHHVWYAMGHMAEAEDEIIERMPSEARAIRDVRLMIEKSLEHKDVEYCPDFGALMEIVANGALLEEIVKDE